jgi:methyl-accepting chemotaxis protein
MDLKDIESTLRRINEGSYAERIDENATGAELKGLVQTLNKTLSKLNMAVEMKHRADIMMRDNPLAIAILKKDKTRIYINKMYEQMWRGTHDELVTKKAL